MNVIDLEPQFWFLLEDGDALFLDANCNHSFVGYSFMIRLSPDEVALYTARGRGYLSDLAQQVQDSAPILAVSRSPFKGRDVSSAHAEAVMEAVARWRDAGR